MKNPVQFLFVVISSILFTHGVIAADLSIRKDYKAEKLTEHVYVIHGPNEMPSKENQGFRNNPVIVLTAKGIVVIDPGSSVYTGELVVKKVKEISKKPVIAVFNTHVHGDHWLGNHGIKKHFKKIDIYAHPKMKTSVEAGDGENWIKAINQRTDGMIQGTKVVGPTKTVSDGDRIKMGGITFRIYHNGKGHSDNDIMIEIVEEKVFVYGDNLRNKNLSPFMSSFTGNLQALDIGIKTGATKFIPGHGKSGGKQIIEDYRRFLNDLKKEVKKHFEAGQSDFEMKQEVLNALNKYRHWTGFDENIGRLINLAYLEVENESF